MDTCEEEEEEETRSEWSAFAVGPEEWSSEALARRMDVEEASGSGGGGLPSAVGSGAPLFPGSYAAKAEGTIASEAPMGSEETRFRVVGALGAEVMVAL